MPTEPKKSIQEVIREVGAYPPDAVPFAHETITYAVETVHKPMSPDQMHIAHWMSQNDVGPEELSERYESEDLPPDIRTVVDRLGGPEKMNRHVSGPELCWAIRDLALNRWGLLARTVLARWNMHGTEDIGRIVFALVENDFLQKQPTDRIEDFDDVFSFREVFDEAYSINSAPPREA